MLKIKDIYIYGAGGLGKEVFCLLGDINAKKERYVFKGFIDGDISKKNIFIGDRSFAVFYDKDFIEKHYNNADIQIVIAIGNPKILKKVSSFLKENTNYSFPNLIHPSLITHFPTFNIGEGNIIAARCIMPYNVKIGNFNLINISCTIGHDTEIGDFNVINPAANISGGVCINNANLIGTNATILQNLCVGNENSISAASLITKNIGDSEVLIGNPARVVGRNK